MFTISSTPHPKIALDRDWSNQLCSPSDQQINSSQLNPDPGFFVNAVGGGGAHALVRASVWGRARYFNKYDRSARTELDRLDMAYNMRP